MTDSTTTGYVRTLDPFTVEIPGVDAVAQPCQKSAPAEVGMRGRVDIIGGTRIWSGQWDTDGVPTELRTDFAQVVEQIGELVEIGNGTAGTVAQATAVADQASQDAGAALVVAGGASGDLIGTSATAPTTRTGGAPLRPGDKYWRLVSVTPGGNNSIVSIQFYNGSVWLPFQIIANSVLVPSSVGNILLADGAVTARVLNVAEAYVGVKLESPNIATDTAAARGIKIVGNTLKAYDAAGNLTVDIGGSDGLIKGLSIEGANIRTSATGLYMFNDGGTGRLRATFKGNPGIELTAYGETTPLFRFYAPSDIAGGQVERVRMTYNNGIQFYDVGGANPIAVNRVGNDIVINGVTVKAPGPENFSSETYIADGTTWTAGGYQDVSAAWTERPAAPVACTPILSSSPSGSATLTARIVSFTASGAVVRVYNTGASSVTLGGILAVRIAVLMK